MNPGSNVMLITQTRVRSDKNQEFAQWQETISETITNFQVLYHKLLHGQIRHCNLII